MMKVLLFIKSTKTPSSRIRVCDLIPHLRQYDIEAEVIPLPTSRLKRWRCFAKAGEYDIVYLQKRLLDHLDFWILRHFSRFLVYDFDDAIYHRNSSPSTELKDYISSTRERKFKFTVKNVDLVIPANAVLEKRTKSVVPDVKTSIIPSSIRLDDIVQKTDYADKEPFVIGWVGTKSTLRYLEYISEELRMLSQKHRFILRVIADQPIEISGVETEFVPWKLEEQYRQISRFDIGLMPLSADPFSEGKAAYKLLQYMSCGVPAVCSPVGMNREVSGDGAYCLCAESKHEFGEQLEKLILDAELRKEIGRRAAQMVREKYVDTVTAEKLASVLNQFYSAMK